METPWQSEKVDRRRNARDDYSTIQPMAGDAPVASQAETGRGSVERRELSAARTKLFPSSHIGPGNLRHSDKTSSSASTNMSTSFSPMMRGGRIFITSIA